MSTPSTLKIRFRRDGAFVFCDKAPGLNTHAVDADRVGLVELLQEQLDEKLFVVHRLDQGTSGALVFSTSKDAAASVGALFERHEVRKRYLFLTDRKAREEAFEASSFIEKKGSSFVSDPRSRAPNAFTRFRRLGPRPLGDLWEAIPASGKPHQIRLHAADRGLPLLGDVEHGGSKSWRLFLHSHSLAWTLDGRDFAFETDEPAWTRTAPGDSSHLAILDAIHAREALFDRSNFPRECVRLVHHETARCRIDQYGPRWIVSWYEDRDPSAKDLSFFESLSAAHGVPIFVRQMRDKGRDPNAKSTWSIGDVSARWTAEENGAVFELRTDTGQSPGLFLDQRENRRWVRDHSRDARVLNLFSYTGGFSVAAARGGAREVTTVDLSANFHDWARANFRLNGLDPTRAGFEFWAQDALLFLKGAIKRGRRWDLVICDPPSFGRSKSGLFRIQHDIGDLLRLLLAVLEPNGRALLSSNYEEWTREDFRERLRAEAGSMKIALEPTPRAGLDYERPSEEPLMKSIFVRRET